MAAEVKISALPAASALDGTELVPVVQGGVTKKSTESAQLIYMGSNFWLGDTLGINANTQISDLSINKTTWRVNAQNPGLKLSLANAVQSGQLLAFTNVGANAFSLYYPDTTTLICSVPVGASVLLSVFNLSGTLTVNYSYFVTITNPASAGANTDITSIRLSNIGLSVKDVLGTHILTIQPGSILTADRSLTITTGDANRTVDISAGNLTFTSFSISFVNSVSASAARIVLGLGDAATQNTTAFLQPSNNLSDVSSVTSALANLNITGKHAVWIPATAMYPSLTSGATVVQVESSTNKNNYRGLSFAQSGNNYAHYRFELPKSWNQSTFTFVVIWKTTGTTGNVVWSIQGLLRNNGDAEDAAFGSAVTLTSAANGSAQATIITAETSAMTAAGTPANGSILEVRINRNGGAGSDTLAATAVLLGVTMFITTNAGNDA